MFADVGAVVKSKVGSEDTAIANSKEELQKNQENESNMFAGIQE